MKLAGLGSPVTFLGRQVMNQGIVFLSAHGSGDGWSHSVNIHGCLAYSTRGGGFMELSLKNSDGSFMFPTTVVIAAYVLPTSIHLHMLCPLLEWSSSV